MNKDEIKKALECCCFGDNCDDCPNNKINGYGCKDKLLVATLDVINKYEKEIEQLRQQVNNLEKALKQRIKEMKKYEIIEELEK